MKKIMILVMMITIVALLAGLVSAAIELNDPVAIHNIGYYTYKEGNFKLAESIFTKAIKLDSNYEKAYASRAIVRFELKDYEGAINDLNKLIIFDSKNVQYWYDLGVNYIANFRYGSNQMQDFCEGINAYETASELNKNYAHVTQNLDALYEIKNNFGLTC